MAETRPINIALWIFSGLALISGVSFSTTLGLLYNKVYSIGNSGGAWGFAVALGFAYIIPGLVGVTAAVLERRGVYIFEVVLGIIGLITMGGVYLRGLTVPPPLAPFSPERCFIKYDNCVCSHSSLRNYVINEVSCEEINFMTSLGTASDGLFIGGAVLLFVAIVLAGVLTRETGQMESHKVKHDNQVYLDDSSAGSVLVQWTGCTNKPTYLASF